MTDSSGAGEAWHTLRHWELDDFYRRVRAMVEALERAFAVGALAEALADGVADVPSALLLDVYGKLADQRPGPLHHLRLDGVRALVAQLREDLFVNTAVARATVLTRRAPRPDDDATSRRPIRTIVASLDGADPVEMRIDQVLAVRFWGVCFELEDVDDTDEIARGVARAAIERLAQDLVGVQKVLRRFDPVDPQPSLKLVPPPRDRRFEHLMLDVLNEHAERARIAPLVEDFLEKTDLRVKYPGLDRGRGGRVQVTQISRADRHEAKLAAIRRVEELVILSPLAVAGFLADEMGRGGEDASVDAALLARFWDSLPARPVETERLADELKAALLRAIDAPIASPLGPLASVPAAVREVIRVYVERRTFDATRRLREREHGTGFATSASGHRRWRVPKPAAGQLTDGQRAALEAMTPGERRRGRVDNVVAYGAFVSLGGATGLLHVSDMVTPEDRSRLAVGQEIDVIIEAVDHERGRVRLKAPIPSA